ncbi:virion structural protein [Burkholderia phage Bm1]
MSFQQAVGYQFNRGLPGEIINDGPTRVAPFIAKLVAAGSLLRVGRAFTYVSGYTAPATGAMADVQKATVGGAGAFAGILVRPKEYALYGTQAGGPLAPSYDVLPESGINLMDMGIIVVEVDNITAAGITDGYGAGAGYVSASGDATQLGMIVPADLAPPAGVTITPIPNSRFKVLDPIAANSSGLAILQLTQ